MQELKSIISGHLRLQFSSEEAADEKLLALLPATIRKRILRHLYSEPLQRCWLLNNTKAKFMDALLGVATVETYMPGVSAGSSDSRAHACRQHNTCRHRCIRTTDTCLLLAANDLLGRAANHAYSVRWCAPFCVVLVCCVRSRISTALKTPFMAA